MKKIIGERVIFASIARFVFDNFQFVDLIFLLLTFYLLRQFPCSICNNVKNTGDIASPVFFYNVLQPGLRHAVHLKAAQGAEALGFSL